MENLARQSNGDRNSMSEMKASLAAANAELWTLLGAKKSRQLLQDNIIDITTKPVHYCRTHGYK